MKILILGYVDYPSWKQALINGAKRLGHTVILCGPGDENDISFYKTNNIRPDVSLEHKYDWSWEYIVNILRSSSVDIGNFDIIIIYETNMNISGDRPQEIRGIPIIYIVTDSHRGCDGHINNFYKMNADYIAYSKPYFKKIYEDWIGREKTFFLPECTDPEIFKPMPEVDEKYDMVWLGHPGINPDRTVEDPIFGENAWRATYIKNLEDRKDFNFKQYGFIRKRQDYVMALNSGKIIFNCGGGTSPLQAQTSNKIFEGMSCGKLILTSYFVDLPFFFQEGKEILSFKSYHHWKHHLTITFDCKEITNIIKYYTTHHDERKEIGNNARKCIIEKYSGEKNIERIKEILEIKRS